MDIFRCIAARSIGAYRITLSFHSDTFIYKSDIFCCEVLHATSYPASFTAAPASGTARSSAGTLYAEARRRGVEGGQQRPPRLAPRRRCCHANHSRDEHYAHATSSALLTRHHHVACSTDTDRYDVCRSRYHAAKYRPPDAPQRYAACRARLCNASRVARRAAYRPPEQHTRSGRSVFPGQQPPAG